MMEIKEEAESIQRVLDDQKNMMEIVAKSKLMKRNAEYDKMCVLNTLGFHHYIIMVNIIYVAMKCRVLVLMCAKQKHQQRIF